MPEAMSGLDQPAPDGLLLDDDLIAELVEDLGPAAFDGLCHVFARDLAQRTFLLRAAIGAADLEEARRVLHAMAGSSASIGAVALASLCRAGMTAEAVGAPLVARIEAEAEALHAALAHRRARSGARV